MARGCCGGGCSCVILAGAHVTIEGSGAPADPFVISANLDLDVVDSTTFDLTLVGSGAPEDPYLLSLAFAPTASIKAFPDWADTTPTNGQVPVWNTTTGQWVPGTNTPAATGAVSHNSSLTGDGSPGSPLAVVHDPARSTQTGASGIGLTDAGINSTVRRFANAAARTATTIAPAVNTISVLDSEPGVYYTWSGTTWERLEAPGKPLMIGSALLELSGPYDDGPVEQIVKNGTATTAADGSFTVLDSTDLTGAAGVLTADVVGSYPTPFLPMVSGETPGVVTCYAFAPGSGEPYAGVAINFQVRALVY